MLISENVPHLLSPSTSLCHLGSRCPGLTAWCAEILNKSENTDTKMALTSILLGIAWQFKVLEATHKKSITTDVHIRAPWSRDFVNKGIYFT